MLISFSEECFFILHKHINISTNTVIHSVDIIFKLSILRAVQHEATWISASDCLLSGGGVC